MAATANAASAAQFFDTIKRKYTANATVQKSGRYFIRLGFAGFNSPVNNRLGYATQAAAEKAILRYQAK